MKKLIGICVVVCWIICSSCAAQTDDEAPAVYPNTSSWPEKTTLTTTSKLVSPPLPIESPTLELSVDDADENAIIEVITLFFTELYDIDEKCDVAYLFMDETDPYIEYCKEKNKLYFGIGKIYKNTIISAKAEIDKERKTEITKAQKDEFVVDTVLKLEVAKENSADTVGYAHLPYTFVIGKKQDNYKIISVTSNDDCDRVLMHTTADEYLQREREEWEGK